MKKQNYGYVLTFLLIFILSACAPEVPPGENQAEVISTIPPLPTVGMEQDGAENLFDESDPADPGSSVGTPESGPPPGDTFNAPVTAAGEVFVLFGSVLDVNGDPVPGAAVEIWQTDANGVYDHPDDLYTRSRDPGFQFYGTSITDENGNYRFRTVRPGAYEPRPPHIHVKIKLKGATVLTTQLYFSDTGNNGGLGAGADQLLVTLEEGSGSDEPLVGEFDFVVDTGVGEGPINLTPSQAEGPYYPVVNVEAYDNDLASVEE